MEIEQLPLGAELINPEQNNSFLDSLNSTLGFEGGFSNSPNDTGGPTLHGISSKWWPEAYKKQADLLAAGKTDDAYQHLQSFYKKNFWDAINADQLDPAMQKIAFDTAVNNGVQPTKKMLKEAEGDPVKLLALRQAKDEAIAAKNPSQEANLPGWSNRISALASEIPSGTLQGNAPKIEELPQGATLLNPPLTGELPQGAELITPSEAGEASKSISRVIAKASPIAQLFYSAAKGGINTISQDLGYGLPIGPQEIYDKNQQLLAQLQAIDTQYPMAIADMKHIHSVSDLGKYLAGNVPEIAINVAGAGIVGKAAGSVLDYAVGKLVTRGVEEGAASLAATEGVTLAKGAGTNFAKATIPAVFGIQAIGQSYEDLLSRGVDAPGTAILAGALNTGLMLSGGVGGSVANSLTGTVLGKEVAARGIVDVTLGKLGLEGSPLSRKILAGAIQGSVEQGAIGSAMQAVNILAENHVGVHSGLFSDESMKEVANAGLSMAILGAPLGAVLHPFFKPPSERDVFLNQGKGKVGKLKPIATEEIGAVLKQEELPLTGGAGVARPQAAPEGELPLNDSTVIEPQKFSPEVIAEAKKLGINRESLSKLTPDEVSKISEYSKAIVNPTDPTKIKYDFSPEKFTEAEIAYRSAKLADTLKVKKLEDALKAPAALSNVEDINLRKKRAAQLLGRSVEDAEKMLFGIKPNEAIKGLSTREELEARAFKMSREAGETGPGDGEITKGTQLGWFSGFDPATSITFESPATFGEWYREQQKPVEVKLNLPGEAKLQMADPVDLKTWFGASKIVDEKGQPKVLYHGTSKDVNFKTFKAGTRGIFMTSDPKAASQYAIENESMGGKITYGPKGLPTVERTNTRSRVIPAYVKMENPYHLTLEDEMLRKSLDAKGIDGYKKAERILTAKAAQLGHDGIDLGNGNYIVFHPKNIKSIFRDKFYAGEAQFHQGELPFRENLAESLGDIVIANNVRALEHTAEGKAKYADIVQAMRRTLTEVASPHIGLKVWDRMQHGLDGSPIRGAQFLNMVHVAINDSTPEHMRNETMYHEIWHALEENGFITDKERQLFDDNSHQLRDYMNKDAYLKNEDFDVLMSTVHGRQELRANAFGKMAVEQNTTGKNTAPAMFKMAFMKAKNFLQRFGNAMKGLGFRTLNDFVQDVKQGSKAKDFATGTFDVGDIRRGTDYLDNILDTQKRIRLNQMQTEYNAHLQQARKEEILKGEESSFFPDTAPQVRKPMGAKETAAEEIRAGIEKAGQLQHEKTQLQGGIWDMTKMIASAGWMASRNPLVGLQHGIFTNMKERFALRLHSYQRLMELAAGIDKTKRYELLNHADTLRGKGIKTFKGTDGKLHWVEDGKEKAFSSQADSDAYQSIQDALKKSHDDEVSVYRNMAYPGLKTHLPDENFTYKDLPEIGPDGKETGKLSITSDITKAKQAILAGREFKNLKAKEKSDYNLLDQVQSNMHSFDNMTRSDYVPHTRFGSHGIVVNDLSKPVLKDGKPTGKYDQPAFYMIETGGVTDRATKGRFNQYQLKETMADLKERYSDTSRYEVIHDGGKVTNFDDHTKLNPFRVNKNAFTDLIDPRYHTVDLLSSLLHAENINPADYKDLRDRIDADFMTRKTAKMFRRNENVHGYSKDWDRALHAKLSGTANYLSKLEHHHMLSKMDEEIAGLSDKTLKKWMENYSDYVKSPQEDWQNLRMFNYVWAMGGNLSSAAVQLSTLPTMTLGQMTKYNPNFLSNAALLGKWSKIAVQYYSGGKSIDSLIKSKTISAEQGRVIRHLEDIGKLQAYFTEAAIGEAESPAGKVKTKVRSLVNIAGMPVILGEMITRFGTAMAAHEMFQDPKVQARAHKILADDYRWQGMVKLNPQMTVAEHMSKYLMDEAHGIYSKTGRPEMYRGLGGAFFFPFMTFPHYAIEGMIRSFGQGPEGKRALAVSLGVIASVAGLMGLPGASAVTKLASTIATQTTGVNTDLENALYEKLYSLTGSETTAKFMTYGLGRSHLGVDMSRRVGIPDLPGQNVLFAALGIDPPTSAYGVEGSLINGMTSAWKSYNAGMPSSKVWEAIMPTGLKNIQQALNYDKMGLMSGGKDPYTIAGPEKISEFSKWSKALGVNSDQISTLREKYQAELLQQGNKMYSVKFDRVKEQGIAATAEIIQAQRQNNHEAVVAATQKLRDVMIDFREFCIEHKIGGAAMTTVNAAIRKGAMQRVLGTPPKAGKFMGQQRLETEAAYGESNE